MTRNSYAVILSMPIGLVLPELADSLSKNGLIDFVRSMRVRMEICWLEIRGSESPDPQVMRRLEIALASWMQERLFPAEHAGRQAAHSIGTMLDVEIIEQQNLPASLPYHGNDETPSILCPKCGSPMILRGTVGRLERSFYGCTNFPVCKGTRPNN